jgi:hypothetical protein
MVISPSCNRLLMNLVGGPQVGRPINIYNKSYTNVFEAAFAQPELAVNWKPGDTVTFSIRTPTREDAAPRLCLAIYLSYDVPQFTINAPQ